MRTNTGAPSAPRSNRRVWWFLLVMLAFLYLPLVPPLINSFAAGGSEGWWLHYTAIPQSSVLMEGIWNTLILGVVAAIVTPFFALAIAQAIRAWRRPRLLLALVFIPLFIPGVSMGVATALFFRVLGIPPSMATMAVVHVLWALPFATLLLLTVMASFDRVYSEAAYMLGASPLRAFFEVELPQIYQGLLGASIFSLILSFNETIRTSLVQGRHNTVQTYIWSKYQQVGLDGTLYAVMTLLILITLGLVALLAWTDSRRAASDQ